jgi:penicillin-binding protein 2
MRTMRSDTPRLRLGIIGIVAVSLFAALFTRLWYLQVMVSPEYQLQATANQRREVVVAAPRGRILDRNGVVLVDNRLSFVASLDRQVLDELEDDQRAEVLDRLVTRLVDTEPGITREVLETRLASDRFSPYTPVPVADDIPEDEAIYLTEHGEDFAGALHVEARAIRTYPYGSLAAHVLGYVGPINDEEYEARRQSPLDYQLTDEIGKGGVEQTYEEVLRGQPGRRVLEVDAEGSTIRELDAEPPVAGRDLYLSIDVTVQAVAEVSLQEELDRARGRRMTDGRTQAAPAGSVVVEDPNDGSILAMASFPTFNPASFTDGIDDAEWAYLNAEANHYPLINRAIQGQYAPGSTFKLVTGFAGLQSGAITPESTYADGGVYRVPNCTGGTCTFRNAGSRRWGRVDLRRAITVSSDVYFYDLGARFWIERATYGDPIQDAANLFGFGADTGVPLANELSGWIPTPENTLQRHEENPTAFPYGEWYTGNNINIAVGQGDVVATPLQLANAYAALANGGHLNQPNVAREVRDPADDEIIEAIAPTEIRTIEFAPGWREALMDGFVGVTQSGEGTANGTFAGFPNLTVAGKTGTAEVDGKADTSLFVGMMPAEQPRFVGAAILEESGFGGAAAGPLIRRIFEALADPALTPTVEPDAQDQRGYRLSIPLPEAADPFASSDQGD